MNKNEIEMCVQIIVTVLKSVKDECEGNCNSCLLNKECCLFSGVPSQWDLDELEKQIRCIINIENNIKRW